MLWFQSLLERYFSICSCFRCFRKHKDFTQLITGHIQRFSHMRLTEYTDRRYANKSRLSGLLILAMGYRYSASANMQENFSKSLQIPGRAEQDWQESYRHLISAGNLRKVSRAWESNWSTHLREKYAYTHWSINIKTCRFLADRWSKLIDRFIRSWNVHAYVWVSATQMDCAETREVIEFICGTNISLDKSNPHPEEDPSSLRWS